tara:strand:+ start:1427 stop:2080 length:654 start_codon:yes stop_codon:yes gene_type:complete
LIKFGDKNKKNMCKCGCNKCKTKSTALVLNESKAPRAMLSKGLRYHIDNNKPLIEHLYREGSRNYFNLFAEARSLYSRGILEFNNKVDLTLLTETNLGHFGIFEGKKVPLDFPIELTGRNSINENEYYVTRNLGRGQGKGLVKSVESDFEEPRVFSKEEAEKYIQQAQSGGAIPGQMTAYWVSDIDMNRVDESKGRDIYKIYKLDRKTRKIVREILK